MGEPTFQWLTRKLNLDNERLAILVSRQPTLLSLNIESSLDPKFEWLKEKLNADEKTMGRLVERFPSILCFSIEKNLEPTIQFYEDCIGHDMTCEIISSFPTILGYSLEKRLKPRFEQVKDAGIIVDAGTIQRMAVYTKEQWEIGMIYQGKV